MELYHPQIECDSDDWISNHTVRLFAPWNYHIIETQISIQRELYFKKLGSGPPPRGGGGQPRSLQERGSWTWRETTGLESPPHLWTLGEPSSRSDILKSKWPCFQRMFCWHFKELTKTAQIQLKPTKSTTFTFWNHDTEIGSFGRNGPDRYRPPSKQTSVRSRVGVQVGQRRVFPQPQTPAPNTRINRGVIDGVGVWYLSATLEINFENGALLNIFLNILNWKKCKSDFDFFASVNFPKLFLEFDPYPRLLINSALRGKKHPFLQHNPSRFPAPETPGYNGMQYIGY